MSYSTGNLALDIEIINNVSRKANNVINKLNTMSATAMTFSSNFANAMPATEKFFSSLKTSLGDIGSAENLDNFTKAFSTISNISKLADLDYNKIAEGFTKLASSVKSFIDEVNKGEASLNSLASALTTISKGTVTKSSENKGLFDIASLGSAWVSVKKIFGTVKSIVSGVKSLADYGADYTETLHFWEVAMGDNIDKAEEFIQKMNSAYSISEKTLLNAQAIYKNMFSALGGVSDDIAYSLSETITQMAVDFASLYNIEFDEAFTKFQSILSGQVRPVRSVSGYDITESTLEELYKSLGGTKTVRNLTQTEKRLLAILAIFNQMEASGAVGDLSETIDTFANRSKQLSDSWEDLKTNVGLVFTTLLEETNILPFLIGLVKGLSNVAKAIANTIKVSDDADKSVGSLDSVFGSTIEGAEEASEAIEELNSNFLDFDKFRVLNSTSDSEEIGIDTEILKAIEKYQSILGETSNDINEIATKIEKIFGVFTDENGELKITETNLQNIRFALDTICGSLFVIAGISIAKLITSFSFLGTALAFIASLIGSFVLFNNLLSSMPPIIRGIVSGLVFLISQLAILVGLVIAIQSFKSSKGGVLGGIALMATGIGAMVASISNFASSIKDLQKYSVGASDIDGGTLFVAGEMGKTEAVYTGENGKSNVANISQLKQAFYGALVDWSAQSNGNVSLTVNLDGETVYKNTTKHAKLHGNHWA